MNTPITGIDNVNRQQFLLGDFNNDGRLDVAVFGTDHVTGQNAVAVLLGNGGGAFQMGRETTFGNAMVHPGSPWAANAGDYNGDSRLDIAFLSQSGQSVVVLPGKGDGTFSSPVATSFRPSYAGLATGDFNNDKKPDLALGNNVGSTGLMLGNGDGTFQSLKTFPIVGRHIAAADLNGDGNLDLVGDQPQGGALQPTVTVLLGDGNGNFPTIHPSRAAWQMHSWDPPRCKI